MDQTRIGFKLAKQAPQRRYVTLAPKSLANAQKRIPAGASNWETRGELEFGRDAQVVWLMPHMHLRGKDMEFSLVTPSEEPRPCSTLSSTSTGNLVTRWMNRYECVKAHEWS
jgi:hypothetical protein